MERDEGELRSHAAVAAHGVRLDAPGVDPTDLHGARILDVERRGRALLLDPFPRDLPDLTRRRIRDEKHHRLAARLHATDRAVRVRRLPTGRETHGEAERGVQEAIALEDAGFGPLSDLEPGDPAQQCSARIAECRIALPADLFRAHGVGRRALLRPRVRVEERRVARVADLEARRQREAGQERRHAHRVVAGRGAQDLAALVGLALHLAAVRCEHRRATGHHERRQALLERLLRRGVPAGRVGDLVPDHAGELVLAVGECEEPARHEHVASRQRERVGLHHVDDVELVVEAAARHTAQQLSPDLVDVGGERRVLQHSDLGLHVLRALAADSRVVVLGHEDGSLLRGLRLR